MVRARGLGGWLQGPGTTPGGAADASAATPGEYPGARLGRPAEGPGSVAGFGRRVAGLAVDWGAALLIGSGLMRSLEWGSMAPLAALFLMHAVLVGTAGFSLGHRFLGLRVDRVEAIPPPDGGAPPGLLRATVRAALLCLAVPPLLVDRDNRGLHDRLAGTVVVRR